MKKLKVVQIGAEHDHAPEAIRSLLRQSDVFDFVGYVIPDDEPTSYYERFRSDYTSSPRLTLEEAFAIPDLDAAVIETSEKHLTKYARLAAERGLAVQMDKPGGDVPEEFFSLISFVKEKNIVFSTGYMYRYNPAIRDAIDIVERGEIGDILSVEAQMSCFHTPEKRAWLGQYPGGMMFFLGCHLVDMIYRLQGEPCEVIPMNCPTGADGVRADDYGFAVFRYPHGISFAKTSAIEVGGFMRRQIVITGTRGSIEINPTEYHVPADETARDQQTDMTVTTWEDQTRMGWVARGEKKVYGPYNRYDLMFRTFADAARGMSPLPYSPDYEEKVYRLLMRACGK